MHNSVNTLPVHNFELSHPFLPDLKTSEEKAREFHRLLLDRARDESEKELKTKLRATADFFRELFFGKTKAQIRSAVLEVLRDYCDVDGKGVFDAHPVEINNLAELTETSEESLLPVLDEMVAAGEILRGRRRRYNEAGQHYNAIYKLKI